MHQLKSILSFYKQFVLWSFIINIAIAIVFPFVSTAILTKLLLTIFVWYMVSETDAKRKMISYKNLGVSTFKLFAILFLVDIFFTITFIVVIKEFI